MSTSDRTSRNRSAGWLLVFLSMLIATPALAQRHQITINAETPEGQVLQQIGQENDVTKKIALMEQFLTQYPKHEGVPWVYAQMVPAYTKAGQFDKAIQAGEKLLAIDPEDVETAHLCLKAAEAKKDPDAVKAWAVRTSEIARKVVQSPKPQDEDEVEDWKRRVDFAKQVETYTEYSLYATALQSTDPRQKAELIETLQEHNPESQYLPQVQGQYFLALQQSGQNEKAIAVAEKILEKDQTNEDMLLVVADYYLRAQKEPDKVVAYSEKLAEVMQSKPKPEGLTGAAWEAKKTKVLGLAYWMSGITYGSQNKYAQADKALREALPLIKGNDQLMAPALFYLGLSNYKLEKIVDAIKFNKECIAIKSPYQAKARQNLAAIRSQYRVVR
jgi:tetratricopeptide (TPR) repeat protein